MPACELAGECCEMTEKCWETEKCCELIAREMLRADKKMKCCELTENYCARVDREMLQLAGLRADRQGNAAARADKEMLRADRQRNAAIASGQSAGQRNAAS
jgi:hypothetical protein